MASTPIAAVVIDVRRQERPRKRIVQGTRVNERTHVYVFTGRFLRHVVYLD